MIFFFSATGNTRWAAKQIAEATGEQLVYIPDVADRHDFDISDNERIGFCFPVHGWRPPLMVREFVRGLRLNTRERHYCYAVCTAGDTIGETMDIFARDLAEAGLSIDSMFSLLMPESFVGLPFMDVDTPQKERQKIETAAGMLDEYISAIVDRQTNIKRLDIGRWPRINSRLIGTLFLKHIVKDTPFKVDTDKCIRCGKCATVCPTNDIDGGAGRSPEWLHNGKCLTCFACYHHCPTKAIGFGHRTHSKGQYWFGHNNTSEEQK